MFKKQIKKVITIEGMMCEHCKVKVENTLLSIRDIKKVKVNLKNKTATIYSINKIDNKIINDAFENLEYKIINIGEDE